MQLYDILCVKVPHHFQDRRLLLFITFYSNRDYLKSCRFFAFSKIRIYM